MEFRNIFYMISLEVMSPVLPCYVEKRVNLTTAACQMWPTHTSIHTREYMRSKISQKVRLLDI